MIDVPRIAGVRLVARPRRPVTWERREYRSPDKHWTVIYHRPREWHMGADGWQVQLRHYGFNVGRAHSDLMQLPGPRGFRHPDAVQPWSHDGGLTGAKALYADGAELVEFVRHSVA